MDTTPKPEVGMPAHPDEDSAQAARERYRHREHDTAEAILDEARAIIREAVEWAEHQVDEGREYAERLLHAVEHVAERRAAGHRAARAESTDQDSA
ncbi:MAG: hypothetical protein ACK5MT_07310 [Actinomycetales bacterium]